MRISDWSSDVCSSDLRDRIAQAPEGSALRFVLRQNDIVDQPGFENGGEFGHELCVQIIAIAAGKLDKGVPRVRRIERRARLRNVGTHRVEATVRDDLKTFELTATRSTEARQVGKGGGGTSKLRWV